MNAAQMQDEIVRTLAAECPALAERATYTPPAPAAAIAVPCTIMFRQPQQVDGNAMAPLMAQQREISILRSDVPAPVMSGTVVRAGQPGVTYRLMELLDDREGMTVWSASRDRT